MPRALLISVGFPSGVYRGSDLRRPEDLPSPARLYAAFIGAAGGGPGAHPEGRALIADPDDRAAVEWLERTSPIGMIAPEVRRATYLARRHRVRVAVDVDAHDYHRDETDFEPFSALSGPVVYAWPVPDAEVCERLAQLAREITHVGEADSAVVVRVWEGQFDEHGPEALVASNGRGPGIPLRIPTPGRAEALVATYLQAITLGKGRHGSGLKSKQATDEPAGSAREEATELRRFAPLTLGSAWPYSEVWTFPVSRSLEWAWQPEYRVHSAVRVHRALVAAIGDGVPEFVSGRQGEGPLSGAGHLAIQFAKRLGDDAARLVLGIPAGVDDADRAVLLEAITGHPIIQLSGHSRGDMRGEFRLGDPQMEPALTFWRRPADRFATVTPAVLDAPGTPRHGEWSLDDAVLCSLGYALRGVLEPAGFDWGSGWQFRQRLVAELRGRGADARAFRVPRSAGRYAHHARAGDLLVAVHAVVGLGTLASGGRGLLAIGRARHLGGGLLVPLTEDEKCL